MLVAFHGGIRHFIHASQKSPNMMHDVSLAPKEDQTQEEFKKLELAI